MPEYCSGVTKLIRYILLQALELNPNEKNSLVARSKCYILLGQSENALKDAETALKEDPKFLKGIYQKAEALYYLGDFEHSLMYYHRGLHIRPDHSDFKLGVHKAQKAIENAIGSAFCKPVSRTSSAVKQTATVSSSRTSTSRTSASTSTSSKCTTPVSSTPKKPTSKSATPVNVRVKSSKKSRLLRELGADKDYLDNLINNPNIKCKFKEDDRRIEDCIKETVDFLNKRQEFWRQQLPPNLK